MTFSTAKKTLLLGGALWIGLTTGCVNYSEKIVLTSEPARYQTPVPVTVAAPGLTRAEVTQVEREVFTQLLQRDFGDEADFSAIFLKADERETALLQKKFPHHHPPIKQLWHGDIRTGFSPMDKDTGRAALVLSAEATDPEDGIVTGIGRWNAGEAVKGFRTYKLQKTGGAWVVVEAR
jgi:hypothetical protein